MWVFIEVQVFIKGPRNFVDMTRNSLLLFLSLFQISYYFAYYIVVILYSKNIYVHLAVIPTLIFLQYGRETNENCLGFQRDNHY